MALSKLKLRKVREEKLYMSYQNSLKEHKKSQIKSLRKVAKNQKKSNCVMYSNNEALQRLLGYMNTGSHQKEFSKIISQIARKGKTEVILQDEKILQALQGVAQEHAYFVRPLESWKPKARNPEKLFSSLVRHLFVKYYVPSSMDSLWFDEDKLGRSWFIDVGQGKNVASCSHFPIRLTKKEAHYFIFAPQKLKFVAAIRYGQAKANGASNALAMNIARTGLGKYLLQNEAFWKVFIEFVIRQKPTATFSEIEILIEYIWSQKFARLWGLDRQGKVVRKEPTQPSFNLKGRTWDSLWRQAFHWFETVGFIPQKPQEWANLITQSDYVKAKTGQCFVFIQLLTKQELFEESQKMNHCVKTYVRSCQNSRAAIFSMRNVLEDKKPLVTLEVNPKQCQVVQIKRRFNASPSTFEIQIIREWAEQNNFKVPSYY